MVAIVRNFATSTTGSITVPSGIVSGDLILLHASNQGNTPKTPAGFTSLVICNATGSSFSNTISKLLYKVSDGTESGTLINLGLTTYSNGITLIAYVGNPGFTLPTFNVSNSDLVTLVAVAGTPNPTFPSKHLIFVGATSISGPVSISSTDPYTTTYPITTTLFSSATMIKNVNELPTVSGTPPINISQPSSITLIIIHVTDTVTTYTASAVLSGQPSYLTVTNILLGSCLLNKGQPLLSASPSIKRVTPWDEGLDSSTLWSEL